MVDLSQLSDGDITVAIAIAVLLILFIAYWYNNNSASTAAAKSGFDDRTGAPSNNYVADAKIGDVVREGDVPIKQTLTIPSQKDHLLKSTNPETAHFIEEAENEARFYGIENLVDDTYQYPTDNAEIDYERYIKEKNIDKRTFDNQLRWVEEMKPWSATTVKVVDRDLDLEATLPFWGLRRPQATNQGEYQYQVTEIDKSDLLRNEPFNFISNPLSNLYAQQDAERGFRGKPLSTREHNLSNEQKWMDKSDGR